MPTIPWIKLYPKMLNDPTIARLPNILWRRLIEFYLAAAIASDGGRLPSREHLAWFLRISPDDANGAMGELVTHGLVSLDPHRNIPNFSAMQAPYSNESWQSLWKRAIMVRDKWACQYCGSPAEHVDHVVPRCQGGADDLDNLVAACAHCNLSKGGRTPEEAGMELL